MESVIERIQRGNFWQFHGGIHPPEQKFLTCNKPIASAQIPEQLIIPIRQHIGQAGDLIIKVGDKVLKGQALSASDTPMSLPVHAPTSGTITAIKSMAIPHPSGLSETCIILTPDGQDTWKQRHICPDFQLLSKAQILEKIANAGISGMGGAGFPTQVKVSTLAKIDYLIINAAECEPYITADDLLIQEHSPTILDGIKIVDHLLTPKHILIGIEDNKPKAIEALQKATADIENIKVCVIPTKYPSGGEKQLIQILTGQEVPSGVLPSSLGIVMQNVATCFAIADAVINDTPLIKRVVTVSGQALEKPQNIWALIGTPVGFLTNQCGYQNSEKRHLIMGGPMMGFSLPHDQVPVIKSTNCILAPSEIEIASPFSSTSSKEVECIRCGQCADVCPAQLLPQELQWSAKAKDQPQLTKLNLFDCIECGACAYVCPSQIPLVHYYRVAKAEIRQQKLLDIKAEKAKVRFEARKLRLEREKIARAEKHKIAAEARKARMNSGTTAAKSEKSAVADALARVKAKKAQASLSTNTAANTADNPMDTSAASTVTAAQNDNSKSQVANAIARAKAKKLVQKNQAKIDSLDTLQDNESPSSTSLAQAAPVVIDKKAKVAAAIAKAKAKKRKAEAASSNENIPAEPTVEASQILKPDVIANESTTEENDNEAGNKKAKVAAAIAKAKLKVKAKADADAILNTEPVLENAEKTPNKTEITATEIINIDHLSENEDNGEPLTVNAIDSSNVDRKAKIAAAVAKAKAKKLAVKSQQTSDIPLSTISESKESEDKRVLATQAASAANKKARIAAAVAKAKAKKLAASSDKSSTSE
ncbi:electron transport complex subunit RsxC [Cognaticolwellia beringensis]|uniref:Ion-translocating oxidoreductase complex subunit C n=1 Tax=Cognaticolwellia beringensis TaxID=1967665 RepID=A0A222GBF7_9GAMM|nr:electron transport complex subunit RsxC [Cognaticolwellia beringensis]ASP49229.1 electron transport complex subunit RsxC [Cognaticolwellia beringensis]